MSAAGSGLLTTHIDGPVIRWTLNRPDKRNALNRGMLNEFLAAIRAAAVQPGLRLAVLSAAGSVFCAGMDLDEMRATAADPHPDELWRQDAQLFRDVLGALLDLPVPVLALVSGPVVAGGLGLLLACDLVIAEERSTFWLPEPRRGITAAIVTPLLVFRIGAGLASYLLLSGRQVDTMTAQRIGLCHEVAAGLDYGDFRRVLTMSILSGAPTALAQAKRQIRGCAGTDLQAQLDAAVIESARARGTADAQEGLAAFLEKRPPKWQNLS